MSDKHTRLPGQTRDTGFQIGVRRTLPLTPEEAWGLLTSDAGVQLWLGDTSSLRFEPGAPYTLADGTHGEMRVYQTNHHLRLTWQPSGWTRPSTIQVRVIPKGQNTTISFHQEWLPGSEEREQRRAHFDTVLEALAKHALLAN